MRLDEKEVPGDGNVSGRSRVSEAVSRDPGLIVVISPTASGNALGRAVCLYLIAEKLSSEAAFLALDDGPIWRPAKEYAGKIVKVKRNRDFLRVLQARTAGAERVVLWHSKPFGPTLSWARRAAAAGLGEVVVDVDDDDAGFGDIFRAERRSNWVQLNPTRRVSPERIRANLQRMRAREVFTVSSVALREHLGLPAHAVVVPHARPITPRVASPRDLSEKRFGFFGTPRSFKGVGYLRQFAELCGDEAELHVFDDAYARATLGRLPNVVWHAPVPLSGLRSVYEKVDVLLLPQQEQPAAWYQLPAKLSDALQFRRVILATPTPPIMEIAGDAFEPVRSWSDPSAVWEAFAAARNRHHSHASRVDRAFREITVDHVASRVQRVVCPGSSVRRAWR